METSKKTIDYFCQFQYRRSGINVKNARATFLRGMGILYIRSRIEEAEKGRGREGGKEREGERKGQGGDAAPSKPKRTQRERRGAGARGRNGRGRPA